jgi:hypothetical protein
MIAERFKVHTIDVDYKGHTRYASEDDPQYKIKSTRPITSRCIKANHSFLHQGMVGRAKWAVFRCVEIVKPTPDARYAVFHSVCEGAAGGGYYDASSPMR